MVEEGLEGISVVVEDNVVVVIVVNAAKSIPVLLTGGDGITRFIP